MHMLTTLVYCAEGLYFSAFISASVQSIIRLSLSKPHMIHTNRLYLCMWLAGWLCMSVALHRPCVHHTSALDKYIMQAH